MDIGFALGQGLTQAVGVTAILYCLAAMGLNIQFGYAGLLNFGQVAFMAVGAYSVGVVAITLGLSVWWALPVALLASTLLAVILGLPTLRLRADYLAIVTIATGEIVRMVVRSTLLEDLLGGTNGLSNVRDRETGESLSMGAAFQALNPLPTDFRLPFLTWTRQDAWVIIVGWSVVALLVVFTWLIMRSPWGRVLKGIREDELAVTSLGKNAYLYKMQALILGGIVGSIGGVMWALAKQSVQPDSFVPDVTFFAYTILLLGGAARILGPVAGTVIFWFLLTFVAEFLNQAIMAGWLPFFTTTDVAAIRFILVGLGLMGLMILRPQGIFGDRRELALDGR